MKKFSRIPMQILSCLMLSILLGIPSQVLSNDDVNLNTLKEIWFEDDSLSTFALQESDIQNENYRRGSDVDSLLKAKFKIISGNLNHAKFFLERIDNQNTNLYSVKKRYLAIIAFLEGKHTLAQSIMNESIFKDTKNFSQICLLKIINNMAVDDVETITNEYKTCQKLTGKYSKNDQYWLETMVYMKKNDKNKIKKSLMTDLESIMSDEEISKIWLKTGLYLNKESNMLNNISNMPESSFESKKVREIIAFMYFRNNQDEKALSFIDDIDTANAENIKGSIRLKKKEYELAFGHFKLALQKKQDSQNSLERAIPLSWILGQWKDGLSMVESSPINKLQDPRNKKTIRIAFLIKEKMYEMAERELNLLKIDFQNNPPIEVNIMDSYISMLMGAKQRKFDKRKAEDSAERACKSFDGMSCYMAMQYIQWDNLGKTLQRKDKTFSDNSTTIDSLKEKAEIQPLIETITVDQRDIEELDSNLVKLK